MGLKLRHAPLALLMLLISQFIFWAMVSVAERQSRPEDLASRPYVDFQVLDKNGEPVAGTANRRAEYQGTSGYRADAGEEGDTDVFSILFQVDNQRDQLALFMAIREQLKEVKVNGITVQPDVPLQELQGAVTSEPAYFLLPMNVLQKGTNILTISKVHEGMVSALPEFTIGPAAQLAEAYRWKSRYLVDIPLAGIAILAFTIALCVAVNWPKDDRPRIRWLTLFLGSCMAFTVVMSFLPQPDSLAVNGAMVLGFQILIGLSMGKFVAYDIGAPRWVHRAIVGVTALATLILGSALASSLIRDEWFEPLFPFAVYRSFTFVIIMCVPCIAALCWTCAARRGEQLLERMIVVICLTTFAIDRLSTSFDIVSPFDSSLPISLYWSPIVGALLGMGMILSLARQASEARRTVVESNAILAARLSEQDAELARSYDAQKQILERQVTLEERQRIVRDMHDGIGGQLLSLMMKVRSGKAPAIDIEQGLQSSMADLRLIVDSMDSADEALPATLRSFEHRARAQVEAAGMHFSAEHGLGDTNYSPGPRPTLQILRILQEAVTNAIRHSGASEIRFASLYDEAGMARISICDDGKGMPTEIAGGRGLISMRNRAATLRGTLDISSSDIGTCLTLHVPLHQPPATG